MVKQEPCIRCQRHSSESTDLVWPAVTMAAINIVAATARCVYVCLSARARVCVYVCVCEREREVGGGSAGRCPLK